MEPTIYTGYLWFDFLNGLTINVQNRIKSFDNCLDKIVQTVDEMDKRLVIFNNNLISSTVPGSFRVNYFICNNVRNSKEGMPVNISDSETGDRNSYQWKNDDRLNSSEPKDILDGISMLVRSSEKVVKLFDKISPNIRNLDTALNIVGDISEGATGIADLFSANGTGTTIARKAGAASEVMVEASGLAEASAVFGTPGLLAGAAILMTDGVIANIAEEQTQKKKMEDEQKLAEASLQTFIMPEDDAVSYLHGIHKAVEQKQHVWKLSFDPMKENFRKYGNEAYAINIPVPIAETDRLSVKSNLPPGLQQNEENAIPVKQSYMEQTFDLQQKLKYAGLTGGRKMFDNAALQAIMNAKSYDKKYHAATIKTTESAINESLYSLLNNANESRIISGDAPKPQKKEIADQFYPSNRNGNKTININLNKPMIEHFTINAKEGKDDANNFKYMVEEVLLEILNSANVIH
jgi:hypothetical protein